MFCARCCFVLSFSLLPGFCWRYVVVSDGGISWERTVDLKILTFSGRLRNMVNRGPSPDHRKTDTRTPDSHVYEEPISRRIAQLVDRSMRFEQSPDMSIRMRSPVPEGSDRFERDLESPVRRRGDWVRNRDDEIQSDRSDPGVEGPVRIVFNRDRDVERNDRQGMHPGRPHRERDEYQNEGVAFSVDPVRERLVFDDKVNRMEYDYPHDRQGSAPDSLRNNVAVVDSPTTSWDGHGMDETSSAEHPERKFVVSDVLREEGEVSAVYTEVSPTEPRMKRSDQGGSSFSDIPIRIPSSSVAAFNSSDLVPAVVPSSYVHQAAPSIQPKDRSTDSTQNLAPQKPLIVEEMSDDGSSGSEIEERMLATLEEGGKSTKKRDPMKSIRERFALRIREIRTTPRRSSVEENPAGKDVSQKPARLDFPDEFTTRENMLDDSFRTFLRNAGRHGGFGDSQSGISPKDCLKRNDFDDVDLRTEPLSGSRGSPEEVYVGSNEFAVLPSPGLEMESERSLVGCFVLILYLSFVSS